MILHFLSSLTMSYGVRGTNDSYSHSQKGDRSPGNQALFSSLPKIKMVQWNPTSIEWRAPGFAVPDSCWHFHALP